MLNLSPLWLAYEVLPHWVYILKACLVPYAVLSWRWGNYLDHEGLTSLMN